MSWQRERELYGGKIQPASIHQAIEAKEAIVRAKRERLVRVLELLSLPLTWPSKVLLAAVRRGVAMLRSVLRVRHAEKAD